MERKEIMQENDIHNVIVEGRKKISVSGVQDMECFDDGRVVVYTCMGIMEVRGSDFHMNKLNLDTGEVVIEGDINSVIYEEANAGKDKKRGILSKMFG